MQDKNYFEGSNGPYFIAEIGGNHEGNFKEAMRLLELACNLPVDAVKFQIYTADSLVNPLYNATRYEHFKKFELKKQEYVKLASECIKRNKEFLASVWDIDAIKWIDPYLNKYKIGSGDLTAFPVIEKIIKTSKPVILSTGLADTDEVLKTVKFIESLDDKYIKEKKIALLQCTTMYPIPDSEANLNVITTLRGKIKLPIGYSDHTQGTQALETAFTLGAQILEFHFTDTRRGKTFRDHKVSLIPVEVERLVKRINKIKILLGDNKKQITEIEEKTNHKYFFRRALYAKKKLAKGTEITKNNIIALRPQQGIYAEDYERILGKKLKTSKKKLEKIDIDEIL